MQLLVALPIVGVQPVGGVDDATGDALECVGEAVLGSMVRS